MTPGWPWNDEGGYGIDVSLEFFDPWFDAEGKPRTWLARILVAACLLWGIPMERVVEVRAMQ